MYPEPDDQTLDLEQVAHKLRRKPSTLRYDICRHPERAPKFFKLPKSRKPLWLKSTVDEFIRRQAAAWDALPSADRTISEATVKAHRAEKKRG